MTKLLGQRYLSCTVALMWNGLLLFRVVSIFVFLGALVKIVDFGEMQWPYEVVKVLVCGWRDV